MRWLIDISPYLEALNYLSGIGLFATVVLGIRQLSLAKKEMKESHKRQAVEKSIEYLSLFASDLIPAVDKISRGLKEEQCKLYSGPFNKQFRFDTNCSNDDINTKKQIVALQKYGATGLLNQLEYFSAAMISGLADEELAFTPLADVYCDTVEDLYVMLCFNRQDSSLELYSYTIQLYTIWKNRLRKIELIKSKDKIESDISGIKDQRIKTIGS